MMDSLMNNKLKKKYGRKLYEFEVICRYFPEDTEGNHKKKTLPGNKDWFVSLTMRGAWKSC